jgi:3-oxoacyl-(acyl-carrier-protein) synthase
MTAPIHITGWGTVCALGADTPTAVGGLRAGRRGLGPATRSLHLTPIDGAPPNACECPIDARLPRRARQIVEVAVAEAVAMAGPHVGTTGVFAGTTGGFFVEADIALWAERKHNPLAAPWFGRRGAGEVAEAVALQVDARGPLATFSMACTSGAAALTAAASHLRAGSCTRAIVVGFDLLASMTIYGFRSLMLTDPRPSRPFDVTRAGLQIGEACGVLVLERGGNGPFRVEGFDNRVDPTNMTGSSIDGSTVEGVIRGALTRSALEPAAVVSVKAHGTGTVDNDLAEGRGIARVFGPQPPPFASLKGAIGHTLGAAGAVEAALWLGCLRAGFVPGSIGFAEMDPEIGVVPISTPIAAPRGAHVFNSFGFGGSCVAFVVTDV